MDCANSTPNDVSIIVPTYKEVNNISELVSRLAQIDFGNRKFEVLIVDDNSEDGSLEMVEKLAEHYAWLKIIVRKKNKGLSRSIIEGFKCAQYPLLIAMDADLSHPPEKILEMLAVLTEPNVDFVIGSRYVQESMIDEVWPLYRKIISKLARLMARIVLRKPIYDPLSGFIAVRKDRCFSVGELNTIGWKIGLEIMVKTACQHIREIPIEFSQRKFGFSKLNARVVCSYFYHIHQLIFYKLFYGKKV